MEVMKNFSNIKTPVDDTWLTGEEKTTTSVTTVQYTGTHPSFYLINELSRSVVSVSRDDRGNTRLTIKARNTSGIAVSD